jgi:catechol 2,3-dioxygenase-like lactoylglutathione lyase family enzyme
MLIHEDIRRIATQISVSDLERSKKFYCEGLGYTDHRTSEATTMEPGTQFARMMGLPGCRLIASFLTRPDGALEMVQMVDPPPYGDRDCKLNNIGAKGMLFHCSDPAGVAARLVELGGTLLFGEKLEYEDEGVMRRIVTYILLDPDGIRIQLDDLPPQVSQAMLGR